MLNLIDISYYIMLIKPYIGRMIARNKKGTGLAGQVLLEYGIILVLVITGLIGLQLYVQRGLQARYKDAADKAVQDIRQAKVEFHLPLQYEPYYQESDITTESDSQITHSYSPGGSSTTVIDHDKTLRTGSRKELPYFDGVGE